MFLWRYHCKWWLDNYSFFHFQSFNRRCSKSARSISATSLWALLRHGRPLTALQPILTCNMCTYLFLCTFSIVITTTHNVGSFWSHVQKVFSLFCKIMPFLLGTKSMCPRLCSFLRIFSALLNCKFNEFWIIKLHYYYNSQIRFLDLCWKS
jgi:hypothetical protein